MVDVSIGDMNKLRPRCEVKNGTRKRYQHPKQQHTHGRNSFVGVMKKCPPLLASTMRANTLGESKYGRQ